MGMNSANAIGDRGEAIFHAVMTRFHGQLPLFRVSHLGEKWPLVDFVCELEGPWKRQRPFFLAQVKATQGGFTKNGQRLKVRIAAERALALSAYKAPVYLVGVDEKSERAFVVGAAGRRISGLTSLHCGGELNTAGRRALWDEVRRYWTNMPRQTGWTNFREPRWK